ncbi:hypothetical protein Aph02nite_03740 [Actinoplanes philippinensis]|uniref:Uncharacterized protein n=1 Tax=Actinoplanes philippinensis TaxID=35752 RepID=A0A1I2D7D4_9ACTN|nr:hypothetical protein [Actinoplanes philippinensis]GIE74424.1 hypothetical protein Aph02nite_03740 [Actinoplanes philippinensis]SFE76428.1 hypothetical protein SAMN05421541_103458 [Actinoplanes philippinensis]
MGRADTPRPLRLLTRTSRTETTRARHNMPSVTEAALARNSLTRTGHIEAALALPFRARTTLARTTLTVASRARTTLARTTLTVTTRARTNLPRTIPARTRATLPRTA